MAEEDNGFAEWGGYMAAKKAKLSEQRAKEQKEKQQDSLFAGISVFVNGRTRPSDKEIKELMTKHGGIYHHYERSDTKYVIASNLCDVKVRNSSTAKIVSPEWLVECIKAKRIVDYTNYLLYTDRDSKQPKIKTFALSLKKSEPTVAKKEPSYDSSTIQHFKVLAEQLTNNLVGNSKDSSLITPPSTPPPTPPSVHSSDDMIKKEEIIMEEENDIEEDEESNLFDETKDASIQSNQFLNISKPSGGGNVAKTAVDPDFLNEFFNNSRLHHIATLGASFKKLICDLRGKKKRRFFPQRLVLRDKLFAMGVEKNEEVIESCIMHIDMDCFFVSVGLRDRPHLKDKPVAVTHSKGGAQATDVPVHPNANRDLEKELFAKKFESRFNNDNVNKVKGGFENKASLSEIASCNYAAREHGLKNGMFVGEAMSLCPDLITIPYNFDAYKEVATILYKTMSEYTLDIEAVSCDEMFVNLADIINDIQVPIHSFVKAIRDIVFERTRCTCSAGIGANKLQARMATKEAKPNGQYYMEPENALSYFANIPIKELPGVGYSTSYTLAKSNLILCSDLQKVTKAKLQALVGNKLGEKLYDFCRGIDNRPMEYEHLRKSVSAEVNYGIRFQTFDELERFLKQLSAEVQRRLLDVDRYTKSVTLKVMVRAKDAPVETSKFMGHGVCDNLTKTSKLNKLTQDVEVITENVLQMMKSLNIPPYELRGLGITLTNLKKVEPTTTSNTLKSLFAKMAEKYDKTFGEGSSGEGKLPKLPLKDATNTKINYDDSKEEPQVPPKILLKDETNTKTTNIDQKEEAQALKKKAPNIFQLFQEQEKKIEKEREREKEDSLPSAIDPEVFYALPIDMQMEIRSTFKKQKPENAKQIEQNQNQEEKKEKVKKKERENGQQKYQENGMKAREASDIDPEVFNALPIDMQREIRLTFKYQKPKQNQDQENALQQGQENETEGGGEQSQAVAKAFTKTNLPEPLNLTQKNDLNLSEMDDLPSTSKAAAQRRLLKESKKKRDNDIDPEFMQALPNSARNEIALKIVSFKQEKPNTNLNGEIKEAGELSMVKIDEVRVENDGISLDSLTSWVENQSEPEVMDIKIFVNSCFFLVDTYNITDLFDTMVHFCRVVMQLREDNCPWHMAFRIIYFLVDEYMLKINDKKLFFNLDINCVNCSWVRITDSSLWQELKANE